MTTVTARHTPARIIRGLRLHLIISSVLIAIEILLGVAVNLFTKLPESDKGKSSMSAFGSAISSGPASLTIHAIIGTLIVLAGISLIIRAISSKNIVQIILGAVGLLAVLIAWSSGTAFIGSQTNAASFSMTIGTIVALLSYTIALFLLRAPVQEPKPI